MIPVLDDQGQKTKATALTALAVRATESDTVQVRQCFERLITWDFLLQFNRVADIIMKKKHE